MDIASEDMVTNLTGFRDIETLSARGMDDLAAWWEQESPAWDELAEDSRDLLSVVTATFGSAISSDARLGL